MTLFCKAVCIASLMAALTGPGMAWAQTVDVDIQSVRAKLQSPGGHWIGIAYGEIGEDLRAHIDLPHGQGLIVREVFPESEAATAGIRKHDILLSAGKVKLESPESLIQAVRKAKGGELSFEVLRKGKKSTIKVTLRQRTGGHRITIQTDKALQGDAGQRTAEARKLVEQLRKQHKGLQILRLQSGQAGPNQRKAVLAAALPGGVSVSITKTNSEPARIKVQRGKDTWEVTADEIDSLPEDLRPGIRDMLNRDGAAAIRLQLNEVPQKIGSSVQRLSRGAQIFRRDRASQSGQKVDIDVKELAEQIRRLTEKVERLEKQQGR